MSGPSRLLSAPADAALPHLVMAARPLALGDV